MAHERHRGGEAHPRPWYSREHNPSLCGCMGGTDGVRERGVAAQRRARAFSRRIITGIEWRRCGYDGTMVAVSTSSTVSRGIPAPPTLREG